MTAPSTATTPDGIEFDTSARHWTLSRDITISLRWIDEFLNEPAKTGALSTLIHYARTYSPATTCMMSGLLHTLLCSVLLRDEKASLITPYMLMNYRGTLNSTTEHYLGSLRSFLMCWVELGHFGIEPEVVPLLNGWRLRGNTKGLAVRITCPKKGALSDLEFAGFQQRLLKAFETGDITLDHFVLVTLFMATGRRPCQLADIKALDFIETRSCDGLSEFVLKVPRRKQRGGRWRAEFKAIALTPEIGMAVRELIVENEATFLALWPGFTTPVTKQLPLFVAWQSVLKMKHVALDSLLLSIEGEAFHRRSRVLGIRLEQVAKSLFVLSERTGSPIRVFPLRLRRTIGTRAAREGYGALIIAELLDHSDTQSASIYTENLPEHVDPLNEAVSMQLAPLAQAFAGVLVDLEAEALRGSDIGSRIRTEGGSNAGTCGHYGFCGACAPVACYTCRHFQPWLDGEHNEVLETLRSERSRIFEATRDPVMSSVNDRTIFAVIEVIRRCEFRRTELKGASYIG